MESHGIYDQTSARTLFPDHGHITNKHQIEKFQEKAMHELQDYAISTYPSQTDRLSKLLLRLPALRLLQPAVMEELFFAGLIGNVQIDSIIPYILRMEGAEYAAQMSGGGATQVMVHVLLLLYNMPVIH